MNTPTIVLLVCLAIIAMLAVLLYVSARDRVSTCNCAARSIRSWPASVPSRRSLEGTDDWVSVQTPENMEEMLLHWTSYDGPNVGWCHLCDRPILSADDLIPGTNTHSCPEGLKLHREHREA
jgi:hypothetical protein